MSVDLPGGIWSRVSEAAQVEWPPKNAADAQAFIARCNSEGLLPLLFEASPPEVRADLEGWRALLAANRQRSRTIASAIAGLPELLGREAVLLKGSDLAFRLYPSPELRPMGDIDVLVRREDLQAVVDRLEKQGFRQRRWRLTHFAADNPDLAFDTGNVTVEVHHSLVHPATARIDYEALHASRIPTPIAGLFRLGDADALLTSLLNIAKDGLQAPLIRYVDVWLMLRAKPALAGDVQMRANAWDARNPVHASLAVTKAMFPDLAIVLDRRPWFDRFVADPAKGFADPHRSVWSRVWRKFWLIDDLALRTRFATKITAAAIQGFFRRDELV